MKKLITLALILSSASAFATRARITALGNSAHLSDAALVWNTPTMMMVVGDSLTVETGVTNNTFSYSVATSADTSKVNLGSEGLIIRSMGDSKFALGLGHDDKATFTGRGIANVLAAALGATWNIKPQQNPLFLGYAMKMGDMSVGAGLRYSNLNNKTTEEKESTMGLSLDARANQWNAALDLGLTDEWKVGAATNDSYKAKTAVAVSGGYNLTESLYLNALVESRGSKLEDNGAEAAEITYMGWNLGVTESIKKDGSEFFYGVGVASTDLKVKVTAGSTEVKTTALNMPLIIGLEADAASWLTLRGSVTQRVLLLDNSKTTNGGTTTSEFSPGTNSTTFAAGAGLKFNKITLDGSLLVDNAGTPVQTINGNNLLGSVGMTYAF
jgi:hypothetical protein